jgi:hypothetical protein
LLETYPARPITASRPAVDDMLTMAPPPLSSIAGISYFIERKTLRRVRARALS